MHSSHSTSPDIFPQLLINVFNAVDFFSMQFYCFQYSRLVFNAVLSFPMQLYSFQCSFSVYNTVFFLNSISSFQCSFLYFNAPLVRLLFRAIFYSSSKTFFKSNAKILPILSRRQQFFRTNKTLFVILYFIFYKAI